MYGLGLGGIVKGLWRCIADEEEEVDEEEEEDSEDERAERLEWERERMKRLEIRLRQEKKREAARRARLEQALASKVGWHAAEACPCAAVTAPSPGPCGKRRPSAVHASKVTNDRLHDSSALLLRKFPGSHVHTRRLQVWSVSMF